MPLKGSGKTKAEQAKAQAEKDKAIRDKRNAKLKEFSERLGYFNTGWTKEGGQGAPTKAQAAQRRAVQQFIDIGPQNTKKIPKLKPEFEWSYLDSLPEVRQRIEAYGKSEEEQATTSTAETQPQLVQPRPDRTIEAAAVIQARFRGQQARQRPRQRAVGEIDESPMLDVDPYPNFTTQQQEIQNTMFEMTRRQHEGRLQPDLRYRLEMGERTRLNNNIMRELLEERRLELLEERRLEERRLESIRRIQAGVRGYQERETQRQQTTQAEPITEEELLGTIRRRPETERRREQAERMARSLEEYPLILERPLPEEPAQWGLDTAQLLGTLATAGATIAGYATPIITAGAAAPLLTTAGVIGTAAAAKVAYDYLYPTVEDVKINDSNEIIRFNNTSINDKTPPLHVYTGVPMDGYTDVDMNKRFIEARNKRQNNILKRKVIMNEGETNKMQYEVAIQDRYNKKMELEKRLRHIKGIADGDNMTPNTAIMVNY